MTETVVVCVKWGTKYPAHYVNRLRNMVGRWLTVPHKFICFTEDAGGLDAGIVTRPFPDPFKGSLNKISLFRGDLFAPGTTILFFDLDIVITGPLDFMLEGPETFKTCGEFSGKPRYNTSVMRIRAGAHADIYDRFQNDPLRHTAIRGDQDFVWEVYKSAGRFPPGKIKSFKFGLRSHMFWFPRSKPLRRRFDKWTAPKWMKTSLPAGVSIVAFHGKPDPEDVLDGPYGPFKHAPFVLEHWR